VLHALLRRWSLRRRRLSFLLDLVLSLLPDSNKIHFRYVLGFWVFQRRGRAGIGGLVLAAVVSVPSFASPAMRLCIQGVWTEQRFPLLRFEVPGFWSYRLAGEAAAISVVWVQKWRVPVTRVWVLVVPVWVLAAASYGL
ncbi:hypothetical protein HID58_071056, partial [Brassica napus]